MENKETKCPVCGGIKNWWVKICYLCSRNYKDRK